MSGKGSGLSMTVNCNVLVTFYSKLNEFTQVGQLNRGDWFTTRHGISTSRCPTRLWSVRCKSHKCRPRLSLFDWRRWTCYTVIWGQKGSAVGQMDYPYHLAVDKQGFILVAYQCNNRVLLLCPSLTYVKELISKEF